MANGLAKLEGFFGGSRRRERNSLERTVARKNSVVGHDPVHDVAEQDRPTFPSPSFIRPTSMHMVARSPIVEHIECTSQEKERSKSLPASQMRIRSRSSAYSRLGDGERRATKCLSTQLSPRAVEEEEQTATTPVLSAFRFPEDALFRAGEAAPAILEKAARSSLEMSPRAVSGPFPSVEAPVAVAESNLLDWSPKHMSQLFNPLEFTSGKYDGSKEPRAEQAESMILMPSPMPAPSPSQFPSMAGLEGQSFEPYRAGSIRTRPSTRKSERKLSLFPKAYSPFKPPGLRPYSPPASDSEEDCRAARRDRTRSIATLASQKSISNSSPDLRYSIYETTEKSQNGSHRDTWGDNGVDDSMRTPMSSDNVSQFRLHKSQSAATLSIVTSKSAQEQVLLQPTLHDFLNLSDEDIAEPRALTPAQDFSLPPAPPPKDEPKRSETKRPATSAKSSSNTVQGISINPASGELTPPETPTDAQFLTLTPPTSPSGHIGALMAAGIAQTYNFDLVYVVSLWPGGGGNALDRSRSFSIGSDIHGSSSDSTAIASPGSRMTGRFLAAYGLNEVPAPFRIATKAHIQALRSPGWREYRDPEASTEGIARGWGCSFHTERIPVAQAGADLSPSRKTMHRGIVFAAFTKQNKRSTIPVKNSPRQDELLERLYADAWMLVDAVMDQPQ